MPKQKKLQKKTKPELVPMKAVKCPVCEGKGRVMSEIIKTYIKCKGCDGKGWVEVHYAEVVKAPEIKPMPQVQPNPADWSPQTIPEPIPWKDYTVTWGDSSSGNYTASSTNADYKITYTGDNWVSTDKGLFKVDAVA